MKDRPDAILRTAQAAYLDRLRAPADPLLTEMEAYAREHDVPISDPEVGRLLEILARGRDARRVLEVGTAIGYGALLMARAAPRAEVVTIERDAATAARAREYLGRGGVAERVQVVEGEALEALAVLDPPFDLVYLDAAKSDYRRYLDLVLPKMIVGGLLVADNVLWKGRVAEPPAEEDAAADALRAFNLYLVAHPQLQALVMPLGDGIGLAVKTRPTMMEMGGPF